MNPEGPKYEEIKKIDRKKSVYKKIVLNQGKIVGAIILGHKKGVATIKRLMDQETEVTKYRDLLLEDDFRFRNI